MKVFDKKVNEIKRTRLFMAIIILILTGITLMWGIIELIPKEIQYAEFDKNEQKDEYVKTKIKYLIGPIIESTDSKTGEKFRYYMAFGLNDELCIVRTGEETTIPIFGKNVTEENMDSIQETEIYGSPELISGSLINVFGGALNTIIGEEIVNKGNLTDVMGAYYFDTVPAKSNKGMHLLILSIILGIFGLLYLNLNRKIRKNVDTTLDELKEQGKLEDVINDYEGGQLIEYKRVKVSVSPKYLYSYNKTLTIIELNNIQEVSFSKKEFGSKDRNKYIIVKTKQNEEYYIAPFQKKKQKRVANELLEKIKSIIV